MLYAHQIPGEEISPGRVRSGGDPIWTGRCDSTGTLGITRFGPIDVAKLTQYSHDWGIFEWHTAPNMKADDHAVYDATLQALDAYIPAGGPRLFPRLVASRRQTRLRHAAQRLTIRRRPARLDCVPSVRLVGVGFSIA